MIATLAEFDVIAGRPLAGGITTSAADFSPPGGAYLVGFEEDIPICGGGVRTLEPSVAEIKRMYVAPEHRRRGLARALLEALEDVAREQGHTSMRLDSTAETWPIYAGAGYREIPDYNGNPHARFWGEKRL
jgi:GNAT superfamily N-acetyltransferase